MHSKNKCGLIERVLDTDSNEPSLASIRELLEVEPSEKDDARRHVIHITWQLMTCVLLSSAAASVAVGLSRLFDHFCAYKIQHKSTKIQATYCVHYRKNFKNPKIFTPNPKIIVRCHDNGDVGDTWLLVPWEIHSMSLTLLALLHTYALHVHTCTYTSTVYMYSEDVAHAFPWLHSCHWCGRDALLMFISNIAGLVSQCSITKF